MRGALDTKTIGRLGIGLLAGLAAGAAPGQQTEAPGTEFFLDLRTGLLVTDNDDRVTDPDDTSTLWQTNATLGFDTRTKNQSLNIRLGALFEYGSGTDEFEPGATDPFLTVAYALANKTSELTFNATVRESDVGSSTILDVLSGDDLVIDQGTRRDLLTQLSFETGKGTPTGVLGSIFYNRVDYSGTTDADLNDTERYGGDLTLRLSVTRTADLSFNTRYVRRDEDDAEDTTETDWQYGIGLDVQLDPSLVLNTALNYAVNEVETTVGGTRITDREEGPTFALGLQKTLKNGTIGANVSSRLTSAGTLTTLRFSRDLALKTGAIQATAGVTWDEGDEVFGIGSLAYTYQGKASQFRASLQRSVRTSDDDDDELVTNAAVSYLQQITELSDVTFAINHTDVDNQASAGVDRQQTSLSVTYSHELTRDWSVNAGVSHSVSSASNRDDIRENRLFANIGRRFSLRP